jgi:hypothetical protein
MVKSDMLRHVFTKQVGEIHNNKTEGVQFTGKLGAPDIQKLCMALKSNTSLKRLYFSRVQFGRFGLSQICKAMASHPTIETLCIKTSLITSPGKSLGLLLAQSKSIKNLRIIDTGLDRQDLKKIFNIVEASQLNAFVLSAKHAEQAVVLRGALSLIRKNRISHLELPITELDYEDAVLLRDAICSNTSLRFLVFDESRCKICAGALTPFLAGISNHPLLTRLFLGTLESESDYFRLIKFLACNKTLQDVNISNELTPKHLKFAVDTLKSNRRLMFFGYNDHFNGSNKENRLFEDYRMQLSDLLDENHNQTLSR